MGECGGGGGLRFPVPHAIGAQAVEFGGVVQSGLVALALLGDHMQNNGFVEVLDVGKGAYQGGNVVSVQHASNACRVSDRWCIGDSRSTYASNN